ncbi:MAG: tetratricopeptide repeat protein, partial [Methylococcaceae bacterium]
YNRGNVFNQLERFEDALSDYDRVLKINPAHVEALYNRGNTLKSMGRLEAALTSYDQALQLRPDHAESLYNKGNTLKDMNRYSEVLDNFDQALQSRPDFADVYINRGNTYKDLGDLAQAEASYRQALKLCPNHPLYRSNLLFLLAYCPERQTQTRYLQEAMLWQQHALTESERQTAQSRTFKPASEAGRPLRLGILSAELSQHAVAHFLNSWLPELDKNRYSLYLYPTRNFLDDKAMAFKAMADVWCPLEHCTDAEAVERIRSDQIDILMETSGHTANNRLGIVARRAAPIQCHYIGYFASTGLTEMDWFLADATLIPPELDHQFVERVWRMPRPWLAYRPLEAAPEPAWKPSEDGRICLGSFNNLVKVREDSLEVWAQVLEALPEAWILLKDGRALDAANQRRITEALVQRGVEANRVVFAGRTATWSEHMALYDQVDIALDTLPLNSGTTAFDALWMGVPLITLAGHHMAGRMGAAIVAGIGRPEWIARDPQEFVSKMVALARDVPTRTELRHTQRERMRASPLCDGAGLARTLETCFERMFDEWHTRHA